VRKKLGGFEEPDLEQSVVDGLAARFGQQLTLDTLQTAQVRVGNEINDQSSEAEQKGCR
jgi:hypothetical protein